MDDLFLADMYILAFVYRNTSRFEAIVKGGKFDPPLLPNDATKNSASQDKENESAANATNPFFKRISDLQTFRAQKIEHLHIEANRFREKMLNLAGTFLCGSNTKCKKNDIYKKIHKQSLAVRSNVLEIIRKLADEKGISCESLHRGYYRWKNKNAVNFIIEKNWPTTEFDHFCALLSVVYLPDDPQAASPLFILCEGITLEVNLLRRSLRERFANNHEDDLLKKEYDKLNSENDRKHREQGMKYLAGKNYLPAVRACIDIEYGVNRQKYLRQAAVLGDSEMQKRCQWKAAGLEDVRFEIAAKNKLRLARTINHPSRSILIKKGTIVHSIRFDTDINSDQMVELKSQLKGSRICEPEFLLLPINTADNSSNTPPVCWKMISVDATVHNFDILMRHADILPSSVRLCFSSRHGKKEYLNNPVVNVQIGKIFP